MLLGRPLYRGCLEVYNDYNHDLTNLFYCVKERTLALQISEELFMRLKGYLAKEGVSQKQFIIGLIEEALNDAEA